MNRAAGSTSGWYLERAKAASAQWVANSVFDLEQYLQRLSASGLKPKVVHTLSATARTASPHGTTAVDRMTLAGIVGRDESTITQHWKLARGAGLMRSRRRWNKSSIHDLTLDGSSGFEYDITDIRPYAWSAGEHEWWRLAASDNPPPAPWGDGRSPF
jgi:hypothetical protein